MTFFSRYAAVFFALVVLATFLPRFFWQAAEGQRNRLAIFYSSVSEGFLIHELDAYGQNFYRTEEGRELDQKDFVSLLPFRYARDLVRWGEMPETIQGVAVEPEKLPLSVQNVFFRPRSLDGPEIPLCFVMEAASGFVDLEMPGEVMRISGRQAEFIRTSDNRVLKEKSLLFTAAFERAGFHFPAQKAWARTSTRKPFDWGWFILDAEGSLFHLIQAKGQPQVRPVLKDFAPGIRYVQVEEHPGRHAYGLLVDWKGGVHRMNYPDYSLTPLPLKEFNPSEMRLTWRRDPLVHHYTVEGGDALSVTVTDHRDAVIREIRMDLPPLRSESARKAEAFFFPFRIMQGVPDSGYLTLRLSWNHDFLLARALGILAALGSFVLWRHWQGRSLKESPADWLVLGVCGFFGLFALLWAGHVPGQKPVERRAV
ncbi:uncharacterized protein DUF4857 [Desulfobotulus alkaliphilus]|uniref:Uncharacterized protein DUF4857 n=1 Tax=Desulfobotulus alkaliphilus TaxID=622671 RepID=A0A562RXV5_9BACT|nr:DUF4857 domain-containing protein [Desulfobotulus alkaliphilus]TWI73226.1 uncharacterized protein DUF4857 [Desulfobotulus alkaliphilus]